MRLISILTVSLLLFMTFESKAQDVAGKGWSGETYFLSSFYRLGSYSKERPTFFLEQNVYYRFNERFSIGLGLGLDFYPSLLAFPVFINGQYHFKIKSLNFTLTQTLGRNFKLSDVFFASNLYRGDLSIQLKLKKVGINPRVGYSFLWDKYGGKNLSFYAGVGVTYELNPTIPKLH